MSDYLTRYDETRRVDLGDDFWVDIKACLTGSAKRRLEAIRVVRKPEPQKDDRGRDTGQVVNVVVKIDNDRYEYELAIASIVDWNLPGGDDPSKKWPLSPDSAKRAHYDLLTEEDQNRIETACLADNADQTEADDAQFPDVGEGSVPTGQDETPDAGQVLAGTEVLEAAGTPA